MPLQQQLFGFEGRLRRRDWWVLGLASSLVWFIVFLVVQSLNGFWGSALFTGPNGYLLFVIADLAIKLPFLWVQMALNAKRAHDINQSATAILLLHAFWAVSSYVPVWIAGYSGAPGLAFMFNAVQFIVVVAAFIYVLLLGFLDGSPLANQYGVSPKAEERPAAPDGEGA